jgi:hypothetical protein
MDRAILMAQLAALTAQLALQTPGSPQQAMTEAQIATLQNELADNPVVPPIFGPHFGPGGGGHEGPHPHGR